MIIPPLWITQLIKMSDMEMNESWIPKKKAKKNKKRICNIVYSTIVIILLTTIVIFLGIQVSSVKTKVIETLASYAGIANERLPQEFELINNILMSQNISVSVIENLIVDIIQNSTDAKVFDNFAIVMTKVSDIDFAEVIEKFYQITHDLHVIAQFVEKIGNNDISFPLRQLTEKFKK